MTLSIYLLIAPEMWNQRHNDNEPDPLPRQLAPTPRTATTVQPRRCSVPPHVLAIWAAEAAHSVVYLHGIVERLATVAAALQGAPMGLYAAAVLFREVGQVT